MFKIVIPGGSGHLGTLLTRHFRHQRHDVIVLGRKSTPAEWREIDGADAVINLIGRSVDCRYGEKHRREILESRVESVRKIATLVAEAKNPPRAWLQASTATLYAHRFDAANDEVHGIIGGNEADAPSKWRFSIDVALAWEKAFDEVVAPRTRKLKLRTAIVMSNHHGSAFPIFRLIAKLGLGGKMGDGKQWVSWIHERDFVQAVEWLIEEEDMSGVFNLAAPNPLPNAEFMRAIRETCGRRFGIGGTAWMLEIAAFVHRTETELLLKSRRVVPRRLL
ncbi:MAG TPA: NAD-dependent epimerase/dehydratase family protein, partial [Thermoanaerobaculia bacterium]|nr:NAD-dependent epimerase/dehydratase family protein [Thermoanaerobaculia bacterium]